MYNIAQKEAFIDSINSVSSQNTARSLLESSEFSERSLNKDLSEFTKEEIIEFLNAKKITNPQSAKRDIRIIRWYFNWIGNKGAEEIVGSITKDDLDFVSAISQSFFADVNDFLDELKNTIPFDQGYYIVPALCLSWMGFKTNEALSLLKEDVDLRIGEIHLNGTQSSLKISPEILQVLRMYQNTSLAYRTQNRTFEVYPQDSIYFLRGMVSKNSKREAKKISKTNLFTEILRVKDLGEKNLGKESRLDYFNVYKSGQLRRVYVAEINDPSILSIKRKSDLFNLFENSGDYYDQVFLYKKYKEAFSLR